MYLLKIQTAVITALLLTVIGVKADDKKIIIALVGDSTVTVKAGWGKAFPDFFDERVEVKNFAVGGRSSKSYIEEGRLAKALESKPDYVFIQFGHNGQKGKGPERETDPATTYRDYLRQYVKEFQKTGAKPILVSSVTRRKFDKNNKIRTSLTPWAKAAEAVAKEMAIPFINLHNLSIAFHNKIGKEASVAFDPKEGDNTHFNALGAKAIAKLVVQDLEKAEPSLAAYLQSAEKKN